MHSPITRYLESVLDDCREIDGGAIAKLAVDAESLLAKRRELLAAAAEARAAQGAAATQHHTTNRTARLQAAHAHIFDPG